MDRAHYLANAAACRTEAQAADTPLGDKLIWLAMAVDWMTMAGTQPAPPPSSIATTISGAS